MKESKGERLEELLEDGFCVAEFYSDGCMPCRMLADVLAQVECEMPFVTVIKLNTSRYPEYTEEFSIRGVPTILYYKDREPCGRDLGYKSCEDLRARIGALLYGD